MKSEDRNTVASKRLNNATIKRVLFSGLLLTVLLVSLNAAYLSSNKHKLEKSVFHFLRADYYLFKPTTYLSGENNTIIRATSVVLAPAVHHLIYNFVILLTVSMAFMYSRNKIQDPKVKKRGLRSPLHKSHLKLKLGKGKKHSERWIVNPYADYTMSLPLPSRRVVSKSGTISALEDALLHILKTNVDVPASIDGHHGATNLYFHSLGVVKRMRLLAKNQNNPDPLIGAIGLAHDLEKIIGYRKSKNGKWEKRSATYQIFGPVIVKSLNEFKALSPTDQQCISRVLAYRHQNGILPLDLSNRQRKLINLLKSADREATANEQVATSSPSSPTTAQPPSAWTESIFEVISELNVNNSLGGGAAEGWHKESDSYVVTTVDNLRVGFLPKLDSELTQSLQLGVALSKRGTHPFKTALVKYLQSKGALIEAIGEAKASEGVFVGTLKFSKQNKISLSNIVLIRKELIENAAPGSLESWSSSAFKITFKSE